MKARLHITLLLPTLLVSALSVGVTAGAATNAAPQPPATSTPEGTNTAVDLPIPKSVFVVPTSDGEGKDPFFPKARGQAPAKPGSTKPTERPGADQLALQGLSGSPERPLAIINGRQFAPGEESDVPVHGGNIHVRCIEIKLTDNLVIVDVAGERRDLRFRTNQ